MAKVFLRVYNHEVESLIEAGQLDEAIAHCQYILKTFPMYVETYRLIGKAFLEGRRYVDAADIFQRTLMAVPDDFVSHVGMSIIRDDENKLDEAIWHMERAFEVQPSNPAIQGELRRLYGRRDGVEPPKIRLSRDALANMYSQGELFNQAIAEIRAVLAEDTNRPDLQVMLARAYLRAGQKVSAAEIAAGLLKKYPYCLDALRILVDVLPGTTKAENTQVYRQRLVSLDPYSSFVTGSVFQSDQVPDSAVSLERMEYKAEGVPAASHKDWAVSLGIKLEGEGKKEPEPTWLASEQGQEEPLVSFEPIPTEPPLPPAAPEAEPVKFEPGPAAPEPAPQALEPSSSAAEKAPETPEPPPGSSDQTLPGWMRSAGWQETNAPTQEAPAGTGEVPPAEPLAAAEIPDWLKSMAPPEIAQQLAAASAKPETLTPSKPFGTGEDFPEWLKSTLPPTEEAPTSVSGPAFTETPEAPQAEAPAPQEEAKTPPPPPKTIPSPPPVPSAGQPSREEQDAALAWLEGLAAKHGGKEEGLETQPAERPEEMPTWLGQAGNEPAEFTPVGSEPPAMPAVEQPEEPSLAVPPVPGPPAEEATPAPLEETTLGAETFPAPQEAVPPSPKVEPASKPLSIEDDTLAWLESLAAKQGAKAEELLTKPEQRSETPPEWVQKAAEEQPGVPESAPPASQVPAKAPAMPAAPVSEGPVVPPVEPTPQVPTEVTQVPEEPETVGDDMTITSWLNKLDVEEAIGKASAKEKPGAVPAPDLPDWLKDLNKPAAPVEPAAASEGEPEWLRSATGPADQAKPAAPEPPGWTDENAPVAAAPAPTTPEEWIPAEKVGAAPKAQPEEQPEASMVEKAAEALEAVPDTQPVTVVFEKTIAAPPPVPPARPERLQPAPEAGIPPVATKPPAKVPSQEKDAELFAAAHADLQGGQLKPAMLGFAKLIKKGRLLEEVIHDLREAIYRFPVDIIVWQTLGDAYMRANRLQDALDAYNKAEELLR